MPSLIRKNLTITIDGNKASVDEPLYMYQGDKNIDIYFTIIDSKFRFSETNSNILADSTAKYSTIKVLKPNGEKIKTDKKAIEDNKIVFTINQEFADEATEIGKYKLQIQLWSIDANNQGRVTIPPIEFEVLEPIFEDDDRNVATVSCLRDDE